MAALVKFHRPSGEPVFINAEHVAAVMEAPGNRTTLHIASDLMRSIEIDIPAEAAAEALTSAASGFVVTNAYINTADPAELEQALADAGKEGAVG